MSLPVLDNHDPRIRYFVLRLEGNIAQLPVLPLPEGYHFSLYQPGDQKDWIAIEQSAREFTSYEQGVAGWNRFYQDRDDFLKHRMVFVCNAKGEKIGTATAYDGGAPDTGRLHWVAIRREDQGKGIAKPMLCRVFDMMRQIGYTKCLINTQTTTWVALKVYMDLGFRPTKESLLESPEGWKIIKRLTQHPALASIPDALDQEVLADSAAI